MAIISGETLLLGHYTRTCFRPVKLWFDPKQIAKETISPELIQKIPPEQHIKNIL